MFRLGLELGWAYKIKGFRNPEIPTSWMAYEIQKLIIEKRKRKEAVGRK